MSKKKITHKNNKANWHKAASRHHIGSVPPTRIQGSGGKGGGGARSPDLSNITLNNIPLDELVVTDQELETTKQEGLKTSLNYRPANVQSTGTFKQKYSGRTGEAKNPYSEEVLAHYQFLVIARGEREAGAYLNSLKGVIMSDSITQFQPQLGPIEKALKEAEEKVIFFRKQAITAQQEELRWAEVVKSLQEALALSTGKKRPEPKPVEGQNVAVHRRAGSMNWNEYIENVLTDKQDGMTQLDLRNKIMQDRNVDSSGAYSAINQVVRNGLCVKIDRRIYLSRQLDKTTGQTA